MRVLPALAGWLLAACGSCGSCGGDGASGEGAQGVEAPAPAATPVKAVLEGVVRLAPGHELPEYSIEQMEAKVLEHTTRGKWPEPCTPPKNADRQPVRLSAEGGLIGMAVAASEFKTGRSRPPKTIEVEIVDCRLTPSLVAAVKGDTLLIKNTVDYPFMPTFGSTAMARTVTPGQNQEFDLDKPGVFPVICGFTAPCGRTDVMVMLHPLHAVTDAAGKFRIEDVPPDEPFVISAWHPLFQETKLDVQVAAGETKQVELVVTPLPSAAAAKSEPSGEQAPAGSESEETEPEKSAEKSAAGPQ